jgi:VWFA-related protein
MSCRAAYGLSHACRRAVVACIALVSVGGGLYAQRPALPGGLQLPDVPDRRERLDDEPTFRAEVTRVEVSALVVDAHGKPVRGLIAGDFELFENGTPQVIRSFIPFSYDRRLNELSDPVLARDTSTGEIPVPRSVRATNHFASSSRIFALILDDLHIDVRRTRTARAAARRLVEQLDPADLLFVTTTSSSYSTGFFTRDRTRALEMIDDMTGQRLLDKTLFNVRFNRTPGQSDSGHNVEAGRLDHYQRLCETIREVSLSLRDAAGRRKTLVLISEGSSFGAGMSDMLNQRYVQSGSSRVMAEALAGAAAGGVAIYPLNPAGLSNAEAELIQDFVPAEMEKILPQLLLEHRQAQEMARDLAALTGGVSLVDTNDALTGIDRAVTDASHHYVLTYEPETPTRGAEYRSIEVKVRRPGVRVHARRGYQAPSTRPTPPLKVPGSLSPQLRTLLSGVMPDDGLPMRVEAVPVSRKGRTTTVAVIVEVDGAVLTGGGSGSAIDVEQGLLTVGQGGTASNGTRRTFGVQLTPVQWQVLGASSLRSVWAVDLPPGVHQLRVAARDTSAGRGGSVFLEVEIPPENRPAPGVLVASRFLSLMPTVFVDKSLEPWTKAMPTATRVFPAGDVLTVTVPHRASAGPAIARLSDGDGRVMWQAEGRPVDGLSDSVQVTIPLDNLDAQVCDLTVETSHGTMRTTIGIVPPQPAEP